MKLDQEIVERVLRHHIETHGLVLCVDMCGQRIHDYELKPPSCQLLGVKTVEGVMSFGVKYDKTSLKFSIESPRLLSNFNGYLNVALANLSTETCKDYRVIPDSVVFMGGPSEWEQPKELKKKIAA